MTTRAVADRDRRRRHRRTSVPGHRRGARAACRASRTRSVTFAGTAQGIESRVVPREGFALDVIRSGGLKGKSLVDRVRGALTGAARVCVDAWNDHRRPAAASRDWRRRLQLGAGRPDRRAARHADDAARAERGAGSDQSAARAFVVRAAAVTFESTREFFGEKAFVSGNPVRPEFVEVGRRSTEAGANERTSAIQVLVFGGSQGAHAINVAMVEAAAKLAAAVPALRLTHQTGERDVDMVRAAYRSGGASGRSRAVPLRHGTARRAKRT